MDNYYGFLALLSGLNYLRSLCNFNSNSCFLNEPQLNYQQENFNFFNDLGFSNFKKNNETNSFSIGDMLADTAEKTAKNLNKSGKCYQGVKLALLKTGLTEKYNYEIYGNSAYMAADQLASHSSFAEVKKTKEQLKTLPKGAIVVWGKTNESPHGHISISLGNGKEASDKVRDQIVNLRGHENFRVFMPVNKLVA